MPRVSVVVPMLDAAGRVGPLHARLAPLLDGPLRPGELILVDDGSADATWAEIRAVASTDERVVGLRLGSNVGQTGALCAGFSVARGEVVVMMDDDLEADPADAVRFIEAVRGGADFASGRRTGPRAPVRAIPSALYNLRLRRRWRLPFHDAGCGFNALTLELARQLASAGWRVRQHRFKPTVAQLTERIVEVPIRVRRTTTSHHTVRSLAASWLDVELHLGSTTRRRFAALGVATPLALSGVAAIVAASPRRGVARLAAAGAAGGAFALSALGADALRRTAAMAVEERRSPPFRIVERVGAAPPSVPSPGSSTAPLEELGP